MAAVVHAGDRLLAHVAALREADGALLEPDLSRQVVGGHVDAVARPPALDADDLRRLLERALRGSLGEQRLDRAGVRGGKEQVDAGVGR